MEATTCANVIRRCLRCYPVCYALLRACDARTYFALRRVNRTLYVASKCANVIPRCLRCYPVCCALLRACDARTYFALRRVNRTLYAASKLAGRPEGWFQVCYIRDACMPRFAELFHKRFLHNMFTYRVPSGDMVTRLWMDYPYVPDAEQQGEMVARRMHVVLCGGRARGEYQRRVTWRRDTLEQPPHACESWKLDGDAAGRLAGYSALGHCCGERHASSLFGDWERFVVPPNLVLRSEAGFDYLKLLLACREGSINWKGVSEVDRRLARGLEKEDIELPLRLEDGQPYPLQLYVKQMLAEEPPG